MRKTSNVTRLSKIGDVPTLLSRPKVTIIYRCRRTVSYCSNKMQKIETPLYEIVRTTCREFQSDRVAVDITAARAFADELDVVTIQQLGPSIAYNSNGLSCKFDSVDDEAAFVVLFHALDFGSGWRLPLHKHHGKGAFLTIQPGVEAVYQFHRKLSSSELVNVTKQEVAKAFALVGNEELDDLVELLWKVILELGRNTQEYGSLTSFFAEKLKRVSHQRPAGDLVWDLVATFPNTFDDHYMVNGQRVCFYKKAQLVVGELYHRFRSEDDRFNFVDGNRLTAYIDNVICATLRYKKVIVPCQELTKKIDNEINLPKGSEDEIALRAAACVGLEEVIRSINLSAMQLDNYLWGNFGKIPEVRKFPRHATKTVFY